MLLTDDRDAVAEVCAAPLGRYLLLPELHEIAAFSGQDIVFAARLYVTLSLEMSKMMLVVASILLMQTERHISVLDFFWVRNGDGSTIEVIFPFLRVNVSFTASTGIVFRQHALRAGAALDVKVVALLGPRRVSALTKYPFGSFTLEAHIRRCILSQTTASSPAWHVD